MLTETEHRLLLKLEEETYENAVLRADLKSAIIHNELLEAEYEVQKLRIRAMEGLTAK